MQPEGGAQLDKAAVTPGGQIQWLWSLVAAWELGIFLNSSIFFSSVLFPLLEFLFVSFNR